MNKIILFILLLPFCIGFSQNYSTKKLSSAAVLKLSNSYLNKALFFQEIPQYNRDSSARYYDKASKLLQDNSPIQYEQLASIYLHRSNIISCNYRLTGIDSLADIGWSYLTKIPQYKRNSLLEYNFLINWASIKLELGEHKQSLALFSKALTIAEDFNSPELVARNLMNKGVFYERYHLDEEQKLSLENLSKSLSYYQKIGEAKKPLELFSIYKSISSHYTEQSSDSVYHYLHKIKSVLKYTKNPIIHAWYYVVLGRKLINSPVYGQSIISQKQYDEGKKNIIKALKIIEIYKIKTSSITPYGYGLLADLNLRNKQYDLAISNYKRSKAGYLFLKNRYAAESMSQFLGEAYQEKGNLPNAIMYFKEYFDQSLIFEKEKNERGLRENELQLNLLTQEKKLVYKQNQQIIFIVALLIVLILLVLSYRNYRLKQKSNNQLALLNNDLESKNLLLDKKNAENELLIKEIHHRVKNNLEVVSSLLALQSAQIDDPNTKEAITEGQNRVNSIGIVHQKLYQGDNLGTIEMKDYFLSLSESILYSYGKKECIDLKLVMDKLDLAIDTAIPLGLIINELMTNTIKYAFPKGEKGIITIKLEKQNHTILHLEVADNGIGKSDITQGTGFGGQLILLLTQQLNGKIKEIIQNGTTIIFEFKLNESA
ncbi:histidine kinase dimerization/phosphoacceptor domain -containing protein [Flavobacterium soyangense]|uniref:histidine kinase n=1 Tax=Flavobacterium soyangense TaxID=2023265 RepID=A0A930U9W9_9FLAO|nr:histidine kinase dimerization/phosphoacceptor domain -containing protein [Flavobacterium soyangense]MBF2709643.1 histidine kinase [Flavobacterium soyangense]